MPLSTLLIVGTFTFAARRCGCWRSSAGCSPARRTRRSPSTAPSCSPPATAAAPTATSPRSRWPAAVSGYSLVGALVHRGWSYGTVDAGGRVRPAARGDDRLRRLPRDRPPGARADQPTGRANRRAEIHVGNGCRDAPVSAPFRSWPLPSTQWCVTSPGIVAVHCCNSSGDAERVAGAVDEQARHGRGVAGARRAACRACRADAADTRSAPIRVPAADPRRHRPPSSRSARPSIDRRARAHPCSSGASPRRARSAATPVGDRVPCAQPCGTRSRRARSASARPLLRSPGGWNGCSTSPRPGTAAGSCQQDPASFAESSISCPATSSFAAVVRMHLAQPRSELGHHFLLGDLGGAHREAQQLQRPRLRVRHRRQRRTGGAGEIGDERRPDRRRASASPCAATGSVPRRASRLSRSTA